MDHLKVTERYYDCWLGGDGSLFEYSPERDRTQPGYDRPFDLYALVRRGDIAISYGKRAATGIEELRRRVDGAMDVPALKRELEAVFGVGAAHSVKYVFENCPVSAGRARILARDDYPLFEAFFCRNNRLSTAGKWLKEYFDGMAAQGLCAGVLCDGILVSCTDAPDMPYMETEGQEIGINTLPEYRGRGFAAQACAAAIAQILCQGKTPIWSASWDNTPSRRLAEKLGFAHYADAIMLTLGD